MEHTPVTPPRSSSPWDAVVRWTVLLVGVLLLVALYGFTDVVRETKQETLQNRVVNCRLLIHNELHLVPGGPCCEPTVLRQIPDIERVRSRSC